MLFHHAQQLIARLGQSGMTESARSISSKSKPVAVPSSIMAGMLNGKTMASLIWLKATVARLMMDSTLFYRRCALPQGFRLTNAIPEFCPRPLKLKPLTVKTLSTLAFSLCR